MFSINQRISSKNNFKIKGRISAILLENVYEIIWDNEEIEVLRGDEIQVEAILSSPWDRLSNNLFDDYRNFNISSIVNKVRNNSANTISTLKASKTIFKPYQFIPLLKLLNSEKKRIIIADEVGLGKTISAGHIILELAFRRELNSLLVVCLNSIQKKWKDELQNKFNVKLKIFESVNEFKEALKNSIENGERIFGIINYDKFRQLKNIEYFKQSAVGFDLIVFDEVHTLRNDTNAKRALIPFTELANAIVMLTATPIMTSLENLYNLIKLLDEEYFSNYQIFQNAININKPFIRAYNQLNAGVSTLEIANELKRTSIRSIFKFSETEYQYDISLNDALSKDELYNSILFEMENNPSISVIQKVKLQEMLINLNSLNLFFTRTRKRDVLTDSDYVQRNPSVFEITMNEVEEKIYKEKIKNFNDDIGSIQIKRKYSSSLFADNYKEEEYLSGIKNINYPDSKYSALREIIHKQNNEKIIIFSFFRKTLMYLRNRLFYDGFNVELIYGGMSLTERNSKIEEFSSNQFQILLSSEVGSTGLDLQFCNRMVNYDLPWNPMVIEQRIGRIDRIGQKSEIINIFNFIYKDTIEEIIYKRLYEKINLFRESIGNLDEILGEKEHYLEGEIEKLYKLNLTDEQRRNRADSIKSAIEKNKLDVQKIDSGLKDSFSNDLYFENEIKAIDENKKYITENDLVELINRLIANKLTSITFNICENNSLIYELTQPDEELIFDFINENYDKSDLELENIYKQFRVKNYGKLIRFTFNQDYAFKNKNVEYISAFHPLINSISNYFYNEKIGINSVFRYALNRGDIADEKFDISFRNNYYFLIRYSFEVKKNINGKIASFIHLKSLVIDLNEDPFYLFNSELSDYFSSICQIHKVSIPEDGIFPINDEITESIRSSFTRFLLLEKESLEINESLKFESELIRKSFQETTDIENRIERIKKNINDNKGILNILKAEIKELEKRRDKLNKTKDNSGIYINSKLISLNLIYIYG